MFDIEERIVSNDYTLYQTVRHRGEDCRCNEY